MTGRPTGLLIALAVGILFAAPLAAEGTKFLLRIDPVSTTVTVIEGRVLCTPTAGGAWHPFTITANQQISGTSRGYAGPVPIDGMRRALWVEQAARSLKRPAVLPASRIN